MLPGRLVEILVATTVLGLLGALAVTGVQQVRQRATRAVCDEAVSATSLAAQAFRSRHGVYPRTATQLVDEGYLRPTGTTSFDVTYAQARSGRGFVVTGRTASGTPCRAEHG